MHNFCGQHSSNMAWATTTLHAVVILLQWNCDSRKIEVQTLKMIFHFRRKRFQWSDSVFFVGCTFESVWKVTKTARKGKEVCFDPVISHEFLPSKIFHPYFNTCWLIWKNNLQIKLKICVKEMRVCFLFSRCIFPVNDRREVLKSHKFI